MTQHHKEIYRFWQFWRLFQIFDALAVTVSHFKVVHDFQSLGTRITKFASTIGSFHGGKYWTITPTTRSFKIKIWNPKKFCTFISLSPGNQRHLKQPPFYKGRRCWLIESAERERVHEMNDNHQPEITEFCSPSEAHKHANPPLLPTAKKVDVLGNQSRFYIQSRDIKLQGFRTLENY